MTQQVNFSDLDFSTDTARARHIGVKDFDGYAVVRIKGRNRKTSSYEVNVSSLVNKHNQRLNQYMNPKKLAIGASKFKKQAAVYFVFDSFSLDGFQITHVDKSTTWVVAFKGAVGKVFKSLDIEMPEKPDTSISVYFKLEAIHGQPNVYKLIANKIIKQDAHGITTTKEILS